MTNRKVVSVAAIATAAVLGTSTLAIAGCSRETPKPEHNEPEIEKVEYTSEELFHSPVTANSVANAKKGVPGIVKILDSEESITLASGYDGTWNGGDGTTTYSFSDFDNRILTMEQAKSILPDNENICLRIGTYMPVGTSLEECMNAVAGAEVLGYEEVSGDGVSVPRAIGYLKGDDGSITYITAERPNGEGDVIFVMKVYVNQSDKMLKKNLGIADNAKPEQVTKAFKDYKDWKGANDFSWN